MLLFLILGIVSASFVSDRPVVAAAGPALSVDAGSNRRAISPLIYGINFADAALAQAVRLPVNRWGGNATTRYNWQNDMANHASDYFFENMPEDNPDPSRLPDDSAADRFVARNIDSNTQTLLTIPLIGWTPGQRKDDHPYDCGFPKAQFPIQQDFDPFDTNCGNGLDLSGNPVTTNSTAANTSVVIDPTFVQDWQRHLIGRYGTAAQGGVRFYDLDNEPGLWHETHRDVHPDHATYAELTGLGQQYAAAIKDIDPGALTLGPVQDGWTRYFYASYGTYPDQIAEDERNAHGGTPFVEWYLQQMADYEQTNGVRLLDYFDLHYYPQADGVSLSPAGNAQTQALRLRTTRSLWDPTYVDESWIRDTEEGNIAVQLIPRMRDWVSRNYPGTKLAISEYNWGALDDINGALAQADVLGIFGREGVDLATLWEPPAATDPGAFAFRMYRNYDGAGAAFGDTSVLATSGDQGQLAIYAALRGGDGALTLMVVNKTGGDLASSVGLAGFSPAATAQVYHYSSANLGAIVHEPDEPVSAGGLSTTFPAHSLSLIIIPPASPPQTTYLPLVRR